MYFMNHWLVAFIILLFQEVLSLNALIFETYQGIYTSWIIHLIFVVVTVFDIWVGFIIGRLVQKRYQSGKTFVFIRKWIDKFEVYAGKKGKRVALFVLGFVSYPYINAFIASWLDVSFAEAFVILFIADVLWYIAAWLVIIGVTTIIPNPSYAFLTIIIISLIVIFMSRKKHL